MKSARKITLLTPAIGVTCLINVLQLQRQKVGTRESEPGRRKSQGTGTMEESGTGTRSKEGHWVRLPGAGLRAQGRDAAPRTARRTFCSVSGKFPGVLSLNPLLWRPVSVFCHKSALPRTVRDTLGTVPVRPGPWQTLHVAYLLSRLQGKVGEAQARARQSQGLWPPTGCGLSDPVSICSGAGLKNYSHGPHFMSFCPWGHQV